MSKKQKKNLQRIIITAIMMIALHFVPLKIPIWSSVHILFPIS